MIQDFANVYVSKQAVRVRAVPIRGNVMVKRIIISVLTGALISGIAASITFSLLIRSGLNELARQTAVKAELTKAQDELLAQRNTLLDQNTLVRTAGKLGLFVPEGRQVRHL